MAVRLWIASVALGLALPHGLLAQTVNKEQSKDLHLSWDWVLLGDNIAQAVMAWSSLIGAIAAVYAARMLWVTLKETRASDERQSRAYMCAAISVNFNSVLNRFEFAIVATNRGQTPAFKSQIAFEWTNEEFKEEFHSGLADGASRGMVGPGAEMHAHGTTADCEDPARSLTSDQCQAIMRGEDPLMVYGRVRYVDAFGVRRHTDFRHRFYVRAGKYGLAVCADGNDAT
jgi:hypothetical protein